jgi:outer membrane protein assembly factor BamB
VVGDRVYIHARRGENEVIAALDLADGREVWAHAIETPYTINPAAMAHAKGPKSTPVVAGDRLCILGISGTLSCLDRNTGKLLWSQDFVDRFPVTAPDFGTAMSPLVVEGLVIVHIGGIETGSLSAFRLENGEEVWSWTGDAPAYTSPIVAILGGTRQLITQSRDHEVGIDLASGALLWSFPFETAFKQNIVTPVVTADGLLVISGLARGTFAVRVSRTDAGWETQEVWRNKDLPIYMSSPVLHDGVIFGHSHMRRGQLFALDAATGETLWANEGRVGENASLVIAGDRLLVLTTDGELHIARASRESFATEARYRVAESPTWAHLVVLDGAFLVKDKTGLSLLELR